MCLCYSDGTTFSHLAHVFHYHICPSSVLSLHPQDLSAMTEEEQLAFALQISMQQTMESQSDTPVEVQREVCVYQ